MLPLLTEHGRQYHKMFTEVNRRAVRLGGTGNLGQPGLRGTECADTGKNKSFDQFKYVEEAVGKS